MPDRALITGASSGIGIEFARQLAERGINLIISGRNSARLEELSLELTSAHSVEVRTMPADLAILGNAQLLYNKCIGDGLDVDILINNAGLGMFGEASSQDPARIEGLLALNVVSLTTLSSLFGGKMMEKKRGYILNVGSLAGNQATPFFASYAASKGYVHRFTLGLRHELRRFGINVTCLQPGYVKTNFDSNAQISNAKYLAVSEKGALSPSRVARIGLRAMYRNRGTSIAGLLNAIAYRLGKLVPETVKASAVNIFVSRLIK